MFNRPLLIFWRIAKLFRRAAHVIAHFRVQFDVDPRLEASPAGPWRKNMPTAESLRFSKESGARRRSRDNDEEYDEEAHQYRSVAKKREQMLRESKRRSLMGFLYFGGGITIGLAFVVVYLVLRNLEPAPGPIEGGGVVIVVDKAINGPAGIPVPVQPPPPVEPIKKDPKVDPPAFQNNPLSLDVPGVRSLPVGQGTFAIGISKDESQFVATSTVFNLYDLRAFRLVQRLRTGVSGSAANQAFISADGQRFFSSMNDAMAISNPLGNTINTVSIGTQCCAMSPDRRYLLGSSRDSYLTCVDLNTLKVVKKFSPPPEDLRPVKTIRSIAWMNDGKMAVTCDTFFIICWDMVKMEQAFLVRLTGCDQLAISQDNKKLAIRMAPSYTSVLFDLEKRFVIGNLNDKLKTRTSAFFAEGKLLMIATEDTQVLDIYDVTTRKKLVSWNVPGKNTWTHTIQVAPSETFALVGGSNNIYYYPLPRTRAELQLN